jgi:hypothetical protein
MRYHIDRVVGLLALTLLPVLLAACSKGSGGY